MGKSGELWQKFSCTAALPVETSTEETNFTWEQSDKAVVINLNVGQKLKTKDVKVEFSKYTASVFIANERKWHFELFDGILPKESRFKRSRTKLVLILKKVYYSYTWLGLESAVRMPLWLPEQQKSEKRESTNVQPEVHSATSSVEQLRRDTEKQVGSVGVSVDTKQRRKKIRVKWVITASEAKYQSKTKQSSCEDDISILGAMVSAGFHDDPLYGSRELYISANNDKVECSDLDNAIKLPPFYDIFVCTPCKSHPGSHRS